MSNFSPENPPDSGYPNAVTLPVWNRFYRKRISAGSLSTLTGCSLECRAHARSIYAPCYTPAGPAAFARDPAASRQVWSAHEGYPGDPAYREFYRDIGFDLPMEHLGSIARGTRKFSGVKYHRITGRGDEKQLYDRTAAENAAAQHAIHFLERMP